MLSLSFTEILLVALVFVVLIGPKELPKILKILVKCYRSYASLRDKITKDIEHIVDSIEQKESIDKRERGIDESES